MHKWYVVVVVIVVVVVVFVCYHLIFNTLGDERLNEIRSVRVTILKL